MANEQVSYEIAELADIHAREAAVLHALDQAYHGGHMEYMFFSPARDVTEARMAALSFAIAAASNQDEKQ